MGGMQALNLAVGGYRCDSSLHRHTGVWGNFLDTTVLAPGMEDLFAYVGAFSQAPTSSNGKTLGASIASSSHRLDLLYVTCGDADGVAFGSGYAPSVDGLVEAAGDKLRHLYQVVIAAVLMISEYGTTAPITSPGSHSGNWMSCRCHR